MKRILMRLRIIIIIAASHVALVQNLLIHQKDKKGQENIIKTTPVEIPGDPQNLKSHRLRFMNHTNAEANNNRLVHGLLFDRNLKKSRVRRRTRNSKKNKKVHIHVVPVMKTQYALSGGFDLNGNIQCNWTAKSRSNMKLYIDSPLEGSRSSIEAYIGIQYTRNYYIYGQVFFHAQNTEMGHCLYVADTYKRPCYSQKCRERPVMCSRSAPGHPESADKVENYNTNYIGGVVRLKRGSTIRLGVLASHHKDMTRSVKIDNSTCYFGAFAVS